MSPQQPAKTIISSQTLSLGVRVAWFGLTSANVSRDPGLNFVAEWLPSLPPHSARLILRLRCCHVPNDATSCQHLFRQCRNALILDIDLL